MKLTACCLSTSGDRNHSSRKGRIEVLQNLMNIDGPAIIIADSSMCTGGRIVDHLQHGLDARKNDIFFVGYHAKGTPGRKMIEKHPPVKAGIHTFTTAYSAHTDKQKLVDWVQAMPEAPKEIRLVHGKK